MVFGQRDGVGACRPDALHEPGPQVLEPGEERGDAEVRLDEVDEAGRLEEPNDLGQACRSASPGPRKGRRSRGPAPRPRSSGASPSPRRNPTRTQPPHPGRTTLRISAAAADGSDTKCSTGWARAASNSSSPYGICSARPARRRRPARGSGTRRERRRRITGTHGGNAHALGEHGRQGARSHEPTSSTRWSAATPAASANRHASGIEYQPMNRSYADPDVWNVLAPSTRSIASTFHEMNETSEIDPTPLNDGGNGGIPSTSRGQPQPLGVRVASRWHADTVKPPRRVAEQQPPVSRRKTSRGGVVRGVQVAKARPQRLDREVRAEHAALGPERLDDALRPGRSVSVSHAPKIVPIASMRVATFGSSARPSRASPGGSGAQPRRSRQASRNGRGPPAAGEAACKLRHPLDLARPRLDRGDQPLIGQKSEAVGRPAVRVGRRGRIDHRFESLRVHRRSG